MRRRHFRLGALLLLLAVPLAALVKSCGFSARIDVIQIFYDKTQYLSFGRCAEPDTQGKVDILYNLITGDQRGIGAGDALLPPGTPLPSGSTGGIRVEFPEAFVIENQPGKTITPTLEANSFVRISKPGSPRAYSLLMDNSRSLDGFDETTGARINLTDPSDSRIAGTQNFFTSERFLNSDRATIIAFHGDGPAGVFPKLRAFDSEPPVNTWFISNKTELGGKLTELKGEENGKTPFYDAIAVGAAALGTLPSNAQKVMLSFNDGPDNSSESTLDDAKSALGGKIPVLSVAIKTLLGVNGERALRELACSTEPQGAVVLATASNLRSRFDPVQFAVSGYWKASISLTSPQGLAPGVYNVTGRMFADPSDAPRTCDEGDTCPDSMECDTGRTPKQCFIRISFSYTVN